MVYQTTATLIAGTIILPLIYAYNKSLDTEKIGLISGGIITFILVYYFNERINKDLESGYKVTEKVTVTDKSLFLLLQTQIELSNGIKIYTDTLKICGIKSEDIKKGDYLEIEYLPSSRYVFSIKK
ncbi:MAG: hypothetical protein ACK40G_12435 [Cytophagaceae bacterium]